MAQATLTPRRRPVHPGQVINRVLFWLMIAFILFYTIFPFYWAIATSLKRGTDLFNTPVQYFPNPLSFESYQYVFQNRDFLRALLNSTITSFATVVLALAIGAMAAYALGRIRFRGKTVILYTTLAMTTFPAIAILPSLYQMIRWAGLYNTIPALVLSYTTFTLPFTVWTLTNFFKAMPGELEEAALVDGATPFQTFIKVLLPLAAPGMVTTGLLAFIGAWSEFLFALTFTQDYTARTVQVAIAQFSGNTGYELPWGNIMAASVVVTIPLIIMVLIFQRRIVAGLTAGAVKG